MSISRLWFFIYYRLIEKWFKVTNAQSSSYCWYLYQILYLNLVFLRDGWNAAKLVKDKKEMLKLQRTSGPCMSWATSPATWATASRTWRRPTSTWPSNFHDSNVEDRLRYQPVRRIVLQVPITPTLYVWLFHKKVLRKAFFVLAFKV